MNVSRAVTTLLLEEPLIIITNVLNLSLKLYVTKIRQEREDGLLSEEQIDTSVCPIVKP
jgi:hypothetical protein